MNKISNPILVHIGLHKTGTSALQKHLYKPKYGFLQHPNRNWVLPIFVDKASTRTLTHREQITVKNFIDNAVNKNLYPVISHERLSGYPLSGGYDRLSIWRRIRSLDAQVKILVTTREQKSWLYSAWKQMNVDGGSISLKKFMKPGPAPAARMPLPRLDYLDYASEIKTLYQIFGKKNVCVLPQEMLHREAGKFNSHILKFLNMEETQPAETMERVNEGKKLSSLSMLRLMHRVMFDTPIAPNGLFYRNKGKFGTKLYKHMYNLALSLPEFPFSKKMDQKNREFIGSVVGDYYDKSNTETVQMTGLDLESLGYSCSRD